MQAADDHRLDQLRLETRPSWGWAGTAREFLSTSRNGWITSLTLHHQGLFDQPPSHSQLEAWRDEYGSLRETFEEALAQEPSASEWGLVFEYELPMEGGRRPDLVALVGGVLAVVEFKSSPDLPIAYSDQVEAYARDIVEYHSTSRDLEVHALLVPTASSFRAATKDAVQVVPHRELAAQLHEIAQGEQLQLDLWLLGEYAPLPSLVRAARRIFEEKPLPRIRRAEAAGVNEAVDHASWLIREAEVENKRLLVLVAGVPGAGKTLVGLRAVYEHSAEHAPASFLSGNGPLVEVLQDALESRVFVRDLHAYIREYGIRGRDPAHNVVVFDEAQRAWDARYMQEKRGISASEPELLIGAGDRMRDWSALVGLVGDGQEIYSGEEGGLGQWRDAILASPNDWQVVCPPRLAEIFSPIEVRQTELLDLTISLRSRRAETLHEWVAALLAGDLEKACDLAAGVREEGFPLWLTRDLDTGRAHLRQRYLDQPAPLYGLLASSQAKNLARLGVDNTFQATKRIRTAKWFNAPRDAEHSGTRLEQPITEFQCQGLELDHPMVCWGDDLLCEMTAGRTAPSTVVIRKMTRGPCWSTATESS